MSTLNPTVRRWLWVAPILLAAAGAIAWGIQRQSGERSSPPPAVESVVSAANVEREVHAFCGSSCHAYPPAEIFPRRYWRSEVERGYRFFEQSGQSMPAPPIERVVKYYEGRAPEELPPADLRPEPYPLSVGFDPVSYPPPPGIGKPAISHLALVRLSGKASGPLDVLACDMQSGASWP